MQKIYLLSLCLLFTISLTAQDNMDDKYISKVKTLDATIETLYAVISGDAGVKRDWDLFRYLFQEDAKLIPSGKNKEGKVGCKYMTPEDYINQSGPWLEKNGFHEVEINRSSETFGCVTQVFSAYEAFQNKADEKPFMRGTNSIQLLNDGDRWWIVNIYWVQESEDNKLPSFPSESDVKGIEQACTNYIEGFYGGDTTKLIASLSPTLHKFGFWKAKDSTDYKFHSYMTFEEAKQFAANVAATKRFAKADARKEIEILDIEDNIAAVKVEAHWGEDYMLLAKREGKWMIEEVIWEGPME
ncbi:MAG: nuclear transport factor 2 family protein [Saprospiraceae bacterium]